MNINIDLSINTVCLFLTVCWHVLLGEGFQSRFCLLLLVSLTENTFPVYRKKKRKEKKRLAPGPPSFVG